MGWLPRRDGWVDSTSKGAGKTGASRGLEGRGRVYTTPSKDCTRSDVRTSMLVVRCTTYSTPTPDFG